MKYTGINILKYIQDLYEENYKILTVEIQKGLNKLRDSLWIGRFNIVKMSILSNWSIDST